MGIKYSFIDSEVYGTDDINSITSCLVGAGVAPFLSADSYKVSDLNSLTSAIAEPGTELGGCRCTGVYLDSTLIGVDVAQGIIFFKSGVRLSVDAEGFRLPVEGGAEGLVFAYYSPSLQFAEIRFASELPENGECVVLARIDAFGKVRDERTFARSKIATIGSNLVIEKEFDGVEPVLYETSEDGKWNWYVVAEINGVNPAQHNYIMVCPFHEDYRTFAFYDIKGDRVLMSRTTMDSGITDLGEVYIGIYHNLTYFFRMVGGKPAIVAKCKVGYDEQLSKYPPCRFEAKIM